jgi:hypothetical protein
MFALSLTASQLEKLQSPEMILMPSSIRKQPNSRIMFFKTLRNMIDRGLPTNNFAQNLSAFLQSYPQIVHATTQLRPQVDFLMSSMEISFEFEHYLQQADQKDERVNLLAQRIKKVINRPSFIKEKYEETEQLTPHAVPLKLYTSRRAEYTRLKDLLVLSNEDQMRYLQLLTYFLNLFTVRAVPRSNFGTLEQSKVNKLLDSQRQFQYIKLMRSIANDPIRISSEELDSLSIDTGVWFICSALERYYAHGEYR